MKIYLQVFPVSFILTSNRFVSLLGNIAGKRNEVKDIGTGNQWVIIREGFVFRVNIIFKVFKKGLPKWDVSR